MGTAKPRKNELNALDLLIEQHAKVDQLIAELEDADEGAGMAIERKRFLFQELADNIAAHSTIEEQLFYPAVRAKQTQEILLESTEEHLSIKRVLADLLDTEVDDARFDAKLAVLKEQLDHHAHEEEEQVLFPKLQRMMTEEELAALGGEMLALFERLMAQQPRKQVPRETRKPAPI